MKRVRLDFNPSKNEAVDAAKAKAAALIDQMNDLQRDSSDAEQKRLCSLAMNAVEEGAMWAVKALTA